MNDNKNTTPKTNAENKPEQPKAAPNNNPETKRTRRSSEAVKSEQRQRYVAQIESYKAAIAELEKKIKDIDDEQKRQTLFELLKDKNLDELCKLANVNPSEL